VNGILTLCDGKDRHTKITPAQPQEIVLRYTQCTSKSCAMPIFGSR